jgi:quercetin 2,3-dioxygenase
MKPRTIDRQTFASEMSVGPMRVKQPLPTPDLEQVSPFLLLHHAGPDHHVAKGPRTRLNPHPHRGFEPVTFLFSGGLHHKDSLGNEGFLQSGDVQWMTAGSGIIHSEGPSREFVQQGGDLELIQLWVNLPRDHKMTTPKYQDIKKDAIPSWTEGGVEVKVVAGEFNGIKGPASTFTPITALTVYFAAGTGLTINVPASYNALIYVLEGTAISDSQEITRWHMAAYHKDGEVVQLQFPEAGKMLFLGGEPISEPLATYGPFVMNYPGEIKQAILDYETGKMGTLES